MKKLYAPIMILLCCAPVMASAQNDFNPDRNKPLEITADNTLEWLRNDLIFVAKGNALAQQGDTSVAGETLTANYREGAGGGMEIWRVTADSNVIIRSKDSQAFGDRATYSLDEGVAVMTGSDLRMVSPDQVVTARDSFEYWVTEGKLVAIGRARVERKNAQGRTDTLEADKITALFKENTTGQRVLHTMEAAGNVTITTAEEVLTGAHGVYRAESNTAQITGGVTITRGPNVLQGEKADLDLTTNTSRMSGGAAAGADGRVRGVFYPKSDKKTP